MNIKLFSLRDTECRMRWAAQTNPLFEFFTDTVNEFTEFYKSNDP